MTNSGSFAAFATGQRPHIEQAIRQVLEREQREAAELGAAYQELVRQLSALVGRGGKRSRPLLFLLAYEAYGGVQPAAALQLAAGLELLHAFLLVHDDIIDRDQLRWGGPNLTGVYYQRFQGKMSKPAALHAAQSQALLGGDLLYSMALRAMTGAGCANTVDILLTVQQAVQVVIAGELADMVQAADHALPSEAEVLRMYQRKTASYSFTLPLQLAALAAGQEATAPLTELAEQLGVAYQLQDDIIGIFSDSSITGKPVASDLREGKRTLLLVWALQSGRPADIDQLKGLMGKPKLSTAAVQRARQLITRSGAPASVQTLIDEQYQSAARLLPKLGWHPMCQQLFADFILTLRDRLR